MLSDAINRRMPYWEELTGLKAESFSIRKAKRIWGRCYINRAKISFNFYLIHKPLEFLDYIILHELTHLKYRYHDKDFYAFIETYMHDWRTIKYGGCGDE